MARALELGMKKTDIIVDGLVATVGANKQAALETLERSGIAIETVWQRLADFRIFRSACRKEAALTVRF